MKTSFWILMVGLALAPAVHADPFDSVVDCTKNVGGQGGVEWTVHLERIGRSPRYAGTVYRNGVELYGNRSVYLELTRTGGRWYWSSDLGTATLNISNSGVGIFETRRYGFSVSQMDCGGEVGTPE